MKYNHDKKLPIDGQERYSYSSETKITRHDIEHPDVVYTKTPYVLRYYRKEYVNSARNYRHESTYAYMNHKFWQRIMSLADPCGWACCTNLSGITLEYRKQMPRPEQRTMYGSLIHCEREAETECYTIYFNTYCTSAKYDKPYSLNAGTDIYRITYYPVFDIIEVMGHGHYGTKYAYLLVPDKKTGQDEVITVTRDRSVTLFETLMEYHATPKKVEKRLKTLRKNQTSIEIENTHRHIKERIKQLLLAEHRQY